MAREVRLVKMVVHWLRDQGKSCTVLGWPDRDPDPWPIGLTVEAVLAIGVAAAPRNWAVDAMTVPAPVKTAAGMAEAPQQLLSPAAKLAARAHRAITIGIRIPTGSPATRKAYYQKVLNLVEEALRTGTDYYNASGEDPGTQVILSDQEFFGDPSGSHGAVRVNLMPFIGDNSDLLAELRVTLAGLLDKKISNQSKRAKGFGYPTLLILWII